MKNILLLFLALSFSLVLKAQQTLTASIEHDGLTRDYILYVPVAYTGNEAAPLVLNFHGYTSNANEQMFYGDFRAIADTAGFLVVHPMGTVDLLGNTHWNVGWGGSNVDDVGFTAALLDSLALSYNIDANRVYSTGMSNGGFMSYQLACQLGDRIAAIASVTGTMNNSLVNNCNPSHPVPVMQIHGTDDGTVPYQGSFLFAPVEQVVSFWVGFNNCDPMAAIENLADLDPNDGTTVEHRVYSEGSKGAAVELYKVFDGGHTWPGAAFNIGVTNQDFRASQEIWRFFSQYSLEALTSTVSTEDWTAEEATWRLYPNPVQDYLIIEKTASSVSSYSIVSTLGQVVRAGSLDQSTQQRLELADLAAGMYYLKIGERSYPFVKN